MYISYKIAEHFACWVISQAFLSADFFNNFFPKNFQGCYQNVDAKFGCRSFVRRRGLWFQMTGAYEGHFGKFVAWHHNSTMQ